MIKEEFNFNKDEIQYYLYYVHKRQVHLMTYE
jgi:hypothetical protein